MSEQPTTAVRRGRPPGRGVEQEKQRKRNRAAIVSAAAKVFAAKPYNQATIDDIISAAGISRATFYVHFDSKLALAVEIYDGIAESWLALFDKLATLKPSPVKLTQWVLALTDLYLDHGYVTPLVEQLNVSEKTFRQRMDGERDLLIDRLADAGLPGCIAAMGPQRSALLQRTRLRLLLERLDQVCGRIARSGGSKMHNVDMYAEALAEELLQRIYGIDP